MKKNQQEAHFGENTDIHLTPAMSEFYQCQNLRLPTPLLEPATDDKGTVLPTAT